MSRTAKFAAPLAALAATVGIIAAASPAQAATATGWVGPAGNYLTTSTINNAPLTASSRIYSTVGALAAPGDLGVRSRLFKSGVLCQAIDYRYNIDATTDFSAGTSQICGSGSYNSHGFVEVWNPTKFTYDEYLTFPSNPLNYTAKAASARTATSPEQLQTGDNAKGQSYGSGDVKAGSPDLIAAYASNGRLGYVKKSDLDRPAPKDPKAAAAQTSTARSIPVYLTDGTTQVGQFNVS